MKIKKILYATDFTECAGQAFPFASFLARKFKAALHILHCIDLDSKPFRYIAPHVADIEKVFSDLSDDFEEKMDTIVKLGDAGDLNITKANIRGENSPATILSYCKQNDIDVIVMGTHGRRGLGYTFLGSVAAEVVRKSPCPVLTIREKKEQRPFTGEGHILVPVDFSEYSLKALDYACEIAATHNAKLDVLHVVEEATYPKVYGIAKNITDIVKDKAKKELDAICGDLIGQKAKYYTHVFAGNNSFKILEYAEKNSSDLIIISTHGLTGFKHFLLGSTTEKVVQQAPCPVFTIKPFGKPLL
jgi:nucleotide-binding universal stress UspA family protein